MSNVYDVVIAGGSFIGAAPQDGFIDPKSSYLYMDQNGNAPSSLVNALAKSRGNRRFKNVIMQIHGMCNAYIVDTAVTGGSVDAPPSSVRLRFEIEHGDASLRTADENNPGSHLLGAAALKRCVARGLMVAESRNIEVFDPTAVTIVQNGANKSVPKGIKSNIADIGPLAASLAAAESAITITKIS